jgi:hypothetical protein
MTNTKNVISPTLSVEEVWTEEKTPQLKKVIMTDGHSEITFGKTFVKPEDIPATIKELERIYNDGITQKNLKQRRMK